ncbi:MAG: hypothetical protein ACYC8V_11095 [Caulobacteraceae bacterium]
MTVDSAPADSHEPERDDVPDHLGQVILGTTGTCNASCVHCPTGKAETAHVPRGPMPIELFKKIIDGIADLGIQVDGAIGFGLFGDGLVDPLVVQRSQYLRTKLPSVSLWVNTNGAAFNTERHLPLNEFITVLSLHCESLIPETYNYLMQPLRAERVFPKYEQILAAFPNKVNVSVPASRKNVDELPCLVLGARRHGRQLRFPLESMCGGPFGIRVARSEPNLDSLRSRDHVSSRGRFRWSDIDMLQ